MTRLNPNFVMFAHARYYDVTISCRSNRARAVTKTAASPMLQYAIGDVFTDGLGVTATPMI